jgi:DNA ligase-1
MEIGDCIPWQGSRVYTITKKGNNSYHCTCPAWKFQKKSPHERKCKHILELLGESKKRSFEQQDNIVKKSIKRRKKIKENNENIPLWKPLLAEKYDESKNIDGYWMSEKYDGVRAYWDGKGKLWSRTCKMVYDAPPWFINKFPKNIPLDGELWCKRDMFDKASSIARSGNDSDWKKMKYLVFDIPNMNISFEKRMAALKKMNLKSPIKCVKHYRCSGKDALVQALEHILSINGEGIMLRQPHSKYVGCRSSSLLKVKKMHDAEAEIVGYEYSTTGKFKGNIKSFKCRDLTTQVEFNCGSGLSEEDRIHPPLQGSIITYQYQNLTKKNIPRFPVYIRVRPKE